MTSRKRSENVPSEMALISGQGTSPIIEEKVKMKKQLGLIEGVAIILGIIFGSGKSLYWAYYVKIAFKTYIHFIS